MEQGDIGRRWRGGEGVKDYYIGCGTEMIHGIDSDPNGERNATCAQCRAEEDHDFDREPNVWFDRAGRITEAPDGEIT